MFRTISKFGDFRIANYTSSPKDIKDLSFFRDDHVNISCLRDLSEKENSKISKSYFQSGYRVYDSEDKSAILAIDPESVKVLDVHTYRRGISLMIKSEDRPFILINHSSSSNYSSILKNLFSGNKTGLSVGDQGLNCYKE